MSPETKLILESIWKRDPKLTKLERELIQCLREGRAPVKLQQAVLPLDNYLPRAAVADKLSVSEVTVWRWEAEEELVPSYVTPDCPRYHPGEVADFVAQRKGKQHSRKLKAAQRDK